MEKVSNILSYFKKELSNIVDEREIISWAYLTIEYLLGYNRSDCIIHANKEITTEITDRIKQIRSEEHTSELQSQAYLVCRLLLEKKNLITFILSITLKCT